MTKREAFELLLVRCEREWTFDESRAVSRAVVNAYGQHALVAKAEDLARAVGLRLAPFVPNADTRLAVSAAYADFIERGY